MRPDHLAERLTASRGFEEQHPSVTPANSALIYARNENAEGGWIIPTPAGPRDGGVPRRPDAPGSVLGPDIPRGSGRPTPRTGGPTTPRSRA